ncbi:cold-shock protein [Oceanibacterium hippocampi]|uniref:Cold shock-like protein CspE n=1 Tax=Oceanibacterium hippocampi TaxID=745714 RepID=A0A1Y5REB6_9PROT|nr:cold shock domain-containing protein [Oceanibacterium hippocampi]SLN15099.1 Cold shock-like protein CspE [Oceanibacterium hippocampi]
MQEHGEVSPGGNSSVVATIKWFNVAKGFGFAVPDGQNRDAFLHASVLEAVGRTELPEGCRVVCDVVEGPRGLQITAIHDVDAEAAPVVGEVSQIEGTVKFFNNQKGFGFVIPDGGGRDIFIHARVIEGAGGEQLSAGQRVRMTVRHGARGPLAEGLDILP